MWRHTRVRAFRGWMATHVGRPRSSRAADVPGQVKINGGRRPGSPLANFRRQAPHRRATTSLHLRHSCQAVVGCHETMFPQPRWHETKFLHGNLKRCGDKIVSLCCSKLDAAPHRDASVLWRHILCGSWLSCRQIVNSTSVVLGVFLLCGT